MNIIYFSEDYYSAKSDITLEKHHAYKCSDILFLSENNKTPLLKIYISDIKFVDVDLYDIRKITSLYTNTDRSIEDIEKEKNAIEYESHDYAFCYYSYGNYCKSGRMYRMKKGTPIYNTCNIESQFTTCIKPTSDPNYIQEMDDRFDGYTLYEVCNPRTKEDEDIIVQVPMKDFNKYFIGLLNIPYLKDDFDIYRFMDILNNIEKNRDNFLRRN